MKISQILLTNMGMQKVLTLMLAALAVTFSSIATAYKVEPIITTFAPKGGQAKKTIDIINDSTEPMAVEISVAGRAIS